MASGEQSSAQGGAQGAGGSGGSAVGDGARFQIIQEGRATITFPLENEVFYNKVQIFNRDLSIACIRLFDKIRREETKASVVRRMKYRRACFHAEGAGEDKPEPLPPTSEKEYTGSDIPGLRILEALAASGLRSIRYFKEIPDVDHIVVNDLSADAVASIRRNVTFNGLDPARVIPHHGDAISVMMRNRDAVHNFDVVDLDPYGTPNLFVDSAVQSVADGGLLCITATDMPTLCGVNIDAAAAKYGSTVVKTKACHEVALRTVLGMVSRHAAVYKRVIEPLISVSVDFYIRIFCRVRTSAAKAKLSPANLGYYYKCTGCHVTYTQPAATINAKGRLRPPAGPPVDRRCWNCGSTFQVGGPIWLAPMADKTFVARLAEDLEAGMDAGAPSETTTPAAGAGAGAGAGASASGGATAAAAAAAAAGDVAVKSGVNTTLGSDAGSNSAATVATSRRRLLGLIRAYNLELLDQPLFADVPQYSATLHQSSPPMLKIWAALTNAGYKVSQSHTSPQAVKTDAPPMFLWDIMRKWEEEHPTHPRHKTGDSVCARILAKPATHKIDFNTSTELRRRWQAVQQVSRFVGNPEGYWGPKSRAKRTTQKGESDRPAKKARK